MAAPFNLNLFPFHRLKGQEWPQIPGLRVIPPPRRPARGREDDQLIVYLTLGGNVPFSSAEYERMITALSQEFHRSPGALTSALRSAADSLNQMLLERNLRSTSKGQYIVGRLILGVLRGPQLFLALCGPVHFFHLAKGDFHHVHEEQSARNGLGASQTTPIHFTQVDLQQRDILALCAVLPSGWEEALKEERGSFESLRRALLAVTTDDLHAVLVQIENGKGEVKILPGAISSPGTTPKPVALPQEKPEPSRQVIATPPPTLPPSRVSSQVASGEPASRFARLIAGQEEKPAAGQEQNAPNTPDSQVKVGTQPAPETGGQPQPGRAPADEAAPESQSSGRPLRLLTRPGGARAGAKTTRPVQFTGKRGEEKEIPQISRPPNHTRQQFFRGLAKWMRGIQVFTHNTGEKIRAFLPNLLPDLRDDEPRVTGVSMAFIAIAIPLLVIMIAMTFYNRRGRTASYQENFDQALAASVWASTQTEPANIRVGWERTLYFINIADDYLETDDLIALRGRAQVALDNLDSIVRLDFKPAILGGLSQTVQVSQLAATNTDLYVLDGSRGSVLRFYLGSGGYLSDAQFNCGPGTHDGVQVGELIDIVATPKVNAFNATLIAIDASGTLLFCRPSPTEPSALQLATPSLGWRSITSITLNASRGILYVLDPGGSAIWYYAPDDSGQFTTLPVMFFGAQVPAGMASAVDIATNGADLFLLFEDGHVTSCSLLEIQGVPKRCSDPVQFIDNRPDRTPGVTISDAYFTHITFAEAPDQALYMFDPLAQAVYKFNPQADVLILQGQFRAAEEDRSAMLPLSATAMTLSPNRYLFISVSGQIYYAVDVP